MAYQNINLGQAGNGSLTASERIESAGEQLDKAYELAAKGEALGKDLRGFLRKIGDSFGLSDKGVNWLKRGVYARVKTPSKLCKKPNWTCASFPILSLFQKQLIIKFLILSFTFNFCLACTSLTFHLV